MRGAYLDKFKCFFFNHKLVESSVGKWKLGGVMTCVRCGEHNSASALLAASILRELMNTLDDLENRTKRVEEKIKLEWMEKVDKALTALKENLHAK